MWGTVNEHQPYLIRVVGAAAATQNARYSMQPPPPMMPARPVLAAPAQPSSADPVQLQILQMLQQQQLQAQQHLVGQHMQQLSNPGGMPGFVPISSIGGGTSSNSKDTSTSQGGAKRKHVSMQIDGL